MTTISRKQVASRNVETALNDGWKLTRVAAGTCNGPDDLHDTMCDWHEAAVPGTVAMSIHDDLDAPGPYDKDDWWYQLEFELPTHEAGCRYILKLGGLATLAEVWLNGTLVLASQNMFVGHRIDVTGLLRPRNMLVISFRSLQAAKFPMRPRARWKTALIEQQSLRWFRTTLLGRMPGWTPPVNHVGPWGAISLEAIARVELTHLQLQASTAQEIGVINIRATLRLHEGTELTGALLRLGDVVHSLKCKTEGDVSTIEGDITVPDAPCWWPHTHGPSPLVSWALEAEVGGKLHALDQGTTGFRHIRVDNTGSSVRFHVNGEFVFCRGACWITNDFLSLRGSSIELRKKLTLAREAGLNMLRVSGTSAYESDEFYDMCDELGILVWQDFMFANMDYPINDASFHANVVSEARYQLERLRRHPCIAAYCGGSEVAQQAAMLGLPSDQWVNDFFGSTLPQICNELHPGVPYFASSPHGGALPFHVGSGISHYYGVGAYRRPLTDVKNARVKFATECLGFSNVPDQETMDLILGGKKVPPHHPRWKTRQPRDNGAGWDFEDIRDHYLRVLFNFDPIELRSQDIERYYAISRVVSGDVMQRVFSEWRNPASDCGGALVWIFADLWPGAGWGIIDSTGRPKAAYWSLKRAWAGTAIRITDEGLDGLNLHLINEGVEGLDVCVEFDLLQHCRTVSASAKTTIQIPARDAITLQGDALLGHFSDSTYAYRFGPPKYDVIIARLIHARTNALLSEDHYFPAGMNLPMQQTASIHANAEWLSDNNVAVTLSSDVFLQFVSVTCGGFSPDDNYFHLSPNHSKRLKFSTSNAGLRRFHASFDALNFAESITVHTLKNEGSPNGDS